LWSKGRRVGERDWKDKKSFKAERRRKVYLRPKIKTLYYMYMAAQGGGGVSFSGDIQDPPGQGPLRPAVGDPALAGGLD